jgi:hypothetical protein
MASACDIAWTMAGQAARGARDEELYEAVKNREEAGRPSSSCGSVRA